MREPMVSSVMTIAVIAVQLDTPFKEVARVLAHHGISAVPVMDGTVVAGVVSEADLLAKQEYRIGSAPQPSARTRRGPEAKWRKAFGVTASHIMTRPAVIIDPDAPLSEALRLLTQANVRRLFVVDRDDTLVGVLARRDLLRTYLRDDEELHDDIRQAVLHHALAIDPDTVRVLVVGGRVRLSGDVDRRSEAERATALTRVLPGVVDVHSELTYRIDDLATR